jgi:prepilin-type N-terminal cleavage/methylation domain-containing protein
MKNNGFSLIELAVVLVIVSLLPLSLLKTYNFSSRDIAKTNKYLSYAIESIHGFAIEHGYLPCPGAVDGKEDCNLVEGFLPSTLTGSAGKDYRVDAYGEYLRYRVDDGFLKSSFYNPDGSINPEGGRRIKSNISIVDISDRLVVDNGHIVVIVSSSGLNKKFEGHNVATSSPNNIYTFNSLIPSFDDPLKRYDDQTAWISYNEYSIGMTRGKNWPPSIH